MLLVMVIGLLGFTFLGTSRMHQVKSYSTKSEEMLKLMPIPMLFSLDHHLIEDPLKGIVFVRDNLISWKNNKQNIVSRSSSKAEYPVMAAATYEFPWLRQLLQQLE